jgi:hypothetical protein
MNAKRTAAPGGKSAQTEMPAYVAPTEGKIRIRFPPPRGGRLEGGVGAVMQLMIQPGSEFVSEEDLETVEYFYNDKRQILKSPAAP